MDRFIATDAGIEQLCSSCGEYWPYDEEFYPRQKAGQDWFFKRRCKACKFEYDMKARGRGNGRSHNDRLFGQQQKRQEADYQASAASTYADGSVGLDSLLEGLTVPSYDYRSLRSLDLQDLS